jgi:hypothetical protein
MTGQQVPTPRTPEEAWQRLVGKWVYSFQATNSTSVMRLTFLPDRKLIRSSSVSGGVMPMPMTNETTSEVASVAMKKDAVLVTLGASSNPLARPGGVLALRFTAANQITIEDGVTYTREE